MCSWQGFDLLIFYMAGVPSALEWILIKQLCGLLCMPGDRKQDVSSSHSVCLHWYWCQGECQRVWNKEMQ